VATHTPRFPISATKLAQQRSERVYSEASSPISRLAVSSVLLAVCPVVLLVGIRGGDFSLLRLLRLFACFGAYTEPQKVLGAYKEPKAMRFAVQPNG